MKNIQPSIVGLITGGTMITASLLAFYVLKLPVESNFQLLIYGIFTAGIVWSLLNYLNSSNSEKSFKDFFSAGFKTFIIVSLLMAVFAFIFFSIHTEFRDTKIAENNKMIIAQGNHLPQEMEENTKQLKKLFLPIMVSSAMFRYLIIGAIVSAVGAGFFSNKKQPRTNQ